MKMFFKQQLKKLNNNQNFLVPKINLTKNSLSPKFNCGSMVEIKLLLIKKLKIFGGDKKKIVIKTNLIEKKLVLKKNLNIHFDKWNWCISTNINMMINIKWAHHNISNNLQIHYVLGLLIKKIYPKKHVLQNFGH
jgi:hypothetical protein